jgi:D-alanine--poly(phosphoribitol) ligase subunit 2
MLIQREDPLDQETIAKRLTEYIRDELLTDSDIESDTPLLSSGLIDSFSLVLLQSFIQKEFGKKIPPQVMKAEGFDRIDEMAGVISKL